MRRAFGYEGCPIVLVGRAREKTIDPVRKFKPRKPNAPISKSRRKIPTRRAK